MKKTNFTNKKYTLNEKCFQLKIPMELNVLIPEDDNVRLLSQFVEEMDLTNLYDTYNVVKENCVSPRQMLKIVLYSYLEGKFSSREMESACKRDINFMYLLEGKPAPDHATFARFRSIHFAPCAKEILANSTKILYELGEVSGEQIFIDGTKIESCANKYTFVWKKAVSKSQVRLGEKMAALMQECVETYGLKKPWQEKVKIKDLKKLRKKLYQIKKEENITFVHGIGKKKTLLQKHIELLEKYLEKAKEYVSKIHRCGNRNSYSKTDNDATFMRMKEDYMGNGQLKPAYNLQHGIDAEYVVWLTISPFPNDQYTLKPFLSELDEFFPDIAYSKIVCDSGYESEENYSYLEDNGKFAYIKPSNYEISRTKKYKQDISNRDNMVYDSETDSYTCSEGHLLKACFTKIRKTRSGYCSNKTVYTCEDCINCPVKAACIKGRNWSKPEEERFKNLEVSRKFERQRAESLARITSNEGIILRINRSIQAEGSFAQLKENRKFRRFLSKGAVNVYAECALLAISHNIGKLHNKIQSERTGTHLFCTDKIA